MSEGCDSPSIPKRRAVTNFLVLHAKAAFPYLGMITCQLLPLWAIFHPKNAKHFNKFMEAAQ